MTTRDAIQIKSQFSLRANCMRLVDKTTLTLIISSWSEQTPLWLPSLLLSATGRSPPRRTYRTNKSLNRAAPQASQIAQLLSKRGITRSTVRTLNRSLMMMTMMKMLKTSKPPRSNTSKPERLPEFKKQPESDQVAQSQSDHAHLDDSTRHITGRLQVSTYPLQIG